MTGHFRQLLLAEQRSLHPAGRCAGLTFHRLLPFPPHPGWWWGAGLLDGSTPVSNPMVGGRPTAGTGPHSTTRCGGLAEAGEVDRRIQIPIHWWASVAAVVDAVAQPEFGFHPAARTQLSRREVPWCGHQRGAVPDGFVAELGADASQRGIPEGSVEAAFAPPAAAAQVLGGQLFDRDDLASGRQGGGRVVVAWARIATTCAWMRPTRAVARCQRLEGSRRVFVSGS